MIFMEHALGARRQILARKNRLQHLPMKTLEGFGRFDLCCDGNIFSVNDCFHSNLCNPAGLSLFVS